MTPNDADDLLLNFEELPLRLRLEGFPEEAARAIAHQWLATIQVVDPGDDAYPIRLETESRLRFSPPSPARPPRQIRLRTHIVGGATELRIPGARMRFIAGQPGAEVEIHPRLIRHPGLMEVSVGGPLGHALALAGASFLHGAAFSVHDLPMLLLGGAGAGKSTFAGAALAAGGTVVSDDSLILYPTVRDGLAVRPLRRNLFLREDSLKVLPGALRQLLQHAGPSTDPRWELDRQVASSVFRTSLEPAVLCVLRQDRRLRSFRLSALSQARALTSLIEANGSPHLLQPAFHGEQQRLLELWSRLANDIPAFELRLGPALLDSPAQILGDVVSGLRQLGAESS